MQVSVLLAYSYLPPNAKLESESLEQPNPPYVTCGAWPFRIGGRVGITTSSLMIRRTCVWARCPRLFCTGGACSVPRVLEHEKFFCTAAHPR